MEEYIQVFTTTEKKDEAEMIARKLLEKRLAGCIQVIGPLTSSYWWRGRIETAEEWVCLIKSKKALYARIEEAIKEVHSYETPEIVAVPVVAGSADYLGWLRSELKEENDQDGEINVNQDQGGGG
ncbi:MAG: divalent-cation tolerance protein CutA [Bacillota bacterium]